MDEKRNHERISLTLEARYQDVRGNVLRGRVRNISLSSAYIETQTPLGTGSPLQLGLDLKELGKVFDVHGRVLRIDQDKGMVVEFTNKGGGALQDLIDLIKWIKSSLGDAGVTKDNAEQCGLKNFPKMSNNKAYQDSMLNKREKRKHSRKLLRIEARYQDDRGRVLKGTVRDISLGGVYIDTNYPLAYQSKLTISLDAVDIGKVIDVEGRVVRFVPHRGMGIEFSDKNNRDIRLLLSAMRKLDQASLLSLSRSGMGAE